MGQITNPIVKGITVLPIDRESGPGAGGNASGNNTIFLGAGAGQGNALSNVIAIGAGAGANIVDAINLNGSVIIGTPNGTALTGGSGTGEPLVIIGKGNLNSTPRADSSVIIGSDNLTAWNNDLTDNVVIGNRIFQVAQSASSFDSSILIGNTIGVGATLVGSNKSIILGHNVFPRSGGLVNFNSIIAIGNDMSSGGSPNIATCIFIGNSIAFNPTQPGSWVAIGHSLTLTGNGGDDDRNVVVGNGITCGGRQNVVIGNAAVSRAVPGSGFGNVVIGSAAGATLPANVQGILVIEEALSIGANPTSLIYGDFTAGNMILGGSVQGVNRDFGGVPGTNQLKLLNGTRATGANVAGGGYFYVTGGVLHWVDSAGIDSQLSESAAGQLASSALVPYTNNAAAAAGTLLNAPVAGNPTKWIPINDNGTIRNIPAW